ncbi:Uncharacterised protein [Escherichia coli]|nr:hypothetical protein [Escherichia coli]CAD6037459.1 Uncharacterised protein [Escherichia coli]CAD6099591.1 Uncharacterised protein [Escherichia coli]CAD6175955.1 Uncharacterised protein [Escherichia coli]
MTEPIKKIIPAYPYVQYNDDPNIVAFFDAYNEIAQQYLDEMNSLYLPCWTSEKITGPLLDWVALGIYGQTRPAIQIVKEQSEKGEYNTLEYNSEPYAHLSNYVAGEYSPMNDDLFKRVLTWNFYKGDGQQFTIPWLKRRIARFLHGPDGKDPGIQSTFDVYVSVDDGVFTLGITDYGDGVAQALASAIRQRYVKLPFMYQFRTVFRSPPAPVSGITLLPEVVTMAPWETATLDVSVIPDGAWDRAFTCRTEPAGVIEYDVDNTSVVLKNGKTGTAVMTVETHEGHFTASTRIIVTIPEKLVYTIRVGSATQPVILRKASASDNITIDYGDGIETTDYQISAAGDVTPGRHLVSGQTYTLTVRNAPTATLAAIPELVSLISIESMRTELTSFCFNSTKLECVADTAFEHCPEVKKIDSLFSRCQALRSVPVRMWTDMPKITSAVSAFNECSLLAMDINELFPADSYPQMLNITSIVQDCASLKGKGLIFITKFPVATQHASAVRYDHGLEDYWQVPDAWGGGGA